MSDLLPLTKIDEIARAQVIDVHLQVNHAFWPEELLLKNQWLPSFQVWAKAMPYSWPQEEPAS